MITTSFKATTVKQTSDYGEFSLEPLEQGYGHTLGNALRRVLLSSLEGAAITEVKIAGVKHQFTTLEGLKEDVVELILNLKQVRLAYEGDKEETLTLQVHGPKTVTAKDIKGPATVKVVNPDEPLATLSDKKAKLDIEMKVVRGGGYSPAEERKSSTVGVIPVDANFSPITRVAYSVEETRVGRRTDYDKLVIKIWTDGSLKPKVALENAARILSELPKQIYAPKATKAEKLVVAAAPVSGEIYDLTVEELELPTRIANALRRGGYKTVKHLAEATAAELAKVKNLGEKSTKKVIAALEKKGIELKGKN
ncbi:MAG: DNA-directed RNA polymerase subunit alpha [Candidatus Chisholmbacteria bacterium]|nr:DNA-directed RNA polymerase subunit alpha [Candidatus Chisholmbacteria bacterium]